MVKIERNPTSPPSLAIERKKAAGSYRERDVISQLRSDFHDKCYLCEIKPLPDIHVEHLRPHHKDRVRMFDWNNLFLSCPHCNSVKSAKKYDDAVLDCCTVDPETVLEHTISDGHVLVKPLQSEHIVHMTAQLLTECFEKKNTGIREAACQVRVEELCKTMAALFKVLKRYKSRKSSRDLHTLRGMLSRTYKFSGFTRAYVREHLKDYPDLAECVT